MSRTRLFRIEGQRFVIGVVFDLDTAKSIQVAPFGKWLLGKRFEEVKEICKRMDWKFKRMDGVA
jgi:hypothetical protein